MKKTFIKTVQRFTYSIFLISILFNTIEIFAQRLAPGVPTLVSPSNNAYLQPGKTVQFTWNAPTSGSTPFSYEIYIYNGSSWSSYNADSDLYYNYLVQETGGSSLCGAAMQWYIKVTNAYGTNYSSTWNFTPYPKFSGSSADYTITPSTSCQSAGTHSIATSQAKYYSFSATSGYTYYFGTCNTGMGCGTNTAWDTYLRIYGTDNSCSLSAYDDDSGACGSGTSYISWTCSFTGTYYLQLTGKTKFDYGTYYLQHKYTCPTLSAGSIGSNQSICYNTTPSAFTQVSAPSGGNGTYTYQWQHTTVGGCGSGWSNISGATATTYQAGNLTQTTCYRRNVTSGSCGTVSSAAITVTVYANLTAGSVGSNQSICYNTSPAAFTQVSAPTGGTGSYTYQWQYTTVSGCGSGWSNVSGATATTYQAGNLTQTTCYRRNVTSGSCGTVSSGAITVTVYANLTAGSVGSSQSICYNTSPAAFTQVSAPSGGTGSYTYQWQYTTVGGCGSGWSNVSGATATTYQAGNLTQTTCYRRNVTSGSCGTVSSGAITVTVYDLPVADAGSDVSIFMGDSTQIGSSPIGGNTYEWTPGTGLSNTTVANPWAKPLHDTKYFLTVTNTHSCSNYDTVNVYVWGTTCQSAIAVNADTYFNPQLFTIMDTVKWFKFVADSTFIGILAYDADDIGSELAALSLFYGNCTNLALIKQATDTLSIGIDTLTISNTYYIKITKQIADTTDFYLVLKKIKGTQLPVFSCQSPTCPDANLVSNPSFNMAGTPPTTPNFTSGYDYVDIPTSPNIMQPNQIGIGNNATDFNYDWTGSGFGGSGNFLLCDGKKEIPTHAQGPIWAQTINVTPESNYYFSFYVNNLLNHADSFFDVYNFTMPKLFVKFNGVTFIFDFELNGTQVSDSIIIIPRLPDQWVQICGMWQAPIGITTVEFEIFAQRTMLYCGNDIGIDEIVFATIELPIISNIDIVDETCIGSTNGIIELTVTDGTQPYNYNWSNSSSSNPATGLTAGTYYVTVTDANGCSATEDAVVDYIASPNWPFHPDTPYELYREQGTDVAVDNDGYVYAVGNFDEEITFDNTLYSNGDNDIYVVKFDPCGNVIWDKKIGSENEDKANSIIVDNNGDIIITGYYSNTINFGGGNRSSFYMNLFVVKYDSDGDWVWDYTYNGTNGDYDQGHDVAVDANNDVYVVGTVYNNDFDIFLNKLDGTDGSAMWNNPVIYHSGTYDYGHGIAYSDNLNQIIITGQIDNDKTYIGKYNPANGNAIVSPINGVYPVPGNTTSGRRLITYYEAPNNIAFIAGSIDYGLGNNKDIMLLSATIDGTSITYQTPVVIGGLGVDFASDLAHDPAGFIFVTGQFTDDVNFNVFPACCTIQGGYDNFVAKYDIDNQVFNWATSSRGTSTETSIGIAMNNVGFGYVTGEFFDTSILGAATLYSHGSGDAFIARLHDLISEGVYESPTDPTSTPTSSKAMVNEMLLYPSPAYEYLNIAVKLKEAEHAKIELFDIYGNKINEIECTTFDDRVFTINVSHLAKGTYIVRLSSNNFTTSQKFLIIN